MLQKQPQTFSYNLSATQLDLFYPLLYASDQILYVLFIGVIKCCRKSDCSLQDSETRKEYKTYQITAHYRTHQEPLRGF